MDNRGIRRRKEGQENDINIDNNGDKFIRETSRNNSNNWNNNIRKYENENKNMHINNSLRNITRKGMSSDDSSNDGKKKSASIFNSANISSISNNCMKSFNNILNNINYNITSATTFNINTSSSSSNNNNNIYSNNYNNNLPLSSKQNHFSNNNFLQNHSKHSFSKGFGIQNNVNVYNQHNNINQRTDSYNYNHHNNNNNNNNNNNYHCGSRNEPTLNSQDLEKLLNNNENINKNNSNSSFGNNFCMNEINSLKNITNDDTYVTCLENLLRNHGNIDTNEMYKYNDKNINCLNDIIFLDVYRAYNVLTYMQEKVSVIIFTINFIGKKLKRKHVPEEVVISLEFLNFCVKNLGLFFARFIDENFMKKISKLLRTTTLKKSLTKDVKSKLSKFLIVPIIHPGVATDPRLHFIKRKILFMMQLWHDSFILHQHICTAIFSEYKSLKEKGITFPIINKAEKFFVKNADKSPSFSDDNILHDIPLNLSQINNIMKSLKGIKNMNNGQEKIKCIQIVSKYKNDILQSINKLSDYKGNSNISVTLNSLLYINDQICIFEKYIEKENSENLQNKQDNNNNNTDKRLENSNDNHQDNHNDNNVNNNIKKKSKKKNKNNRDSTEMDHLNNIIFNKYDPWNVEQKNENNNENDNVNKLFFNNDSDHFNQNQKNTSFKNLVNNQNNDTLLFNNDIMFSFAENDLHNVKDISKKNENNILLDHIENNNNNNNNNNNGNNIMQASENTVVNVDDKYSFFNELNDFEYNSYNISSSQNINKLELNNNNNIKDYSCGKDTISDPLHDTLNNQKTNDISKEKEKLDDPISNQINHLNSSSLNILNNNMRDDSKELNNEFINEKNNIYMETDNLSFSNFKRQDLHEFNNENTPFTTNEIKNDNLQFNNEDNDFLNDKHDNTNLKLEKNNIILKEERNKSLYLDNNNNNNNNNDTNRDNTLNVYDNLMIDNTSYIISTDTSSYKPKSSPDIKNHSIGDNEQNYKNDDNHLNYTYNEDNNLSKEEDVKEMNVYDHMSKDNYHDLFDTFGFNTNEEKDQKEEANKNMPIENIITDNISKENVDKIEYKINAKSNDENYSDHNTQKVDDIEHMYNNNMENNDNNNKKSDNIEDNNNNNNNYDKVLNKDNEVILDPLDNNKINAEYDNTPAEHIVTNNEKIEHVKNNNTNNNISIQHNENEQKSDEDEDKDDDSNDINFDEIDEITKAIDDLNDNFESMDMYKYDH
ncbi:hypothetical protein PGSY75_1307700 [Plasmodium gaboni]|uniref:VHS domain-containing protein n=1 Tax=Plasmodium gaboni TaxID=647221 RepID=A0A151LD65_9APIC|nr:hypothetical protein PGSY75_1307700 [Plasmodium gaboni]KYN96879.1 hypothetical protein PGSY75_1307700 [Plasmodium gaboni]